MLELKFIKLIPSARLPVYGSDEAACFDLFCSEDFMLDPGKIRMVCTGLSAIIPKGYELQVRSRSGLASKGIIVANGIGTVDCDYTGELKVLLLNTTDKVVFYGTGSRVAQAMLSPITRVNILCGDKHEQRQTNRNCGGFGSTGI